MALTDRVKGLLGAKSGDVSAGKLLPGNPFPGNSLAEAQGVEVARLRPKQVRVLELLVEGKKTTTQATEEAGVDRSTFYLWLKKDAEFAAAYNQWKEQVAELAKSRVLLLVDKAADAVEKALERGDGRLGLRLLEKTGMVKERAAGQTDAEILRRDRELDRKKEEILRAQKEEWVEGEEIGLKMRLGRPGG